MTNLPARIEAGVATDAEVAVALGLVHKMMFAAPGEGWFDGDTLIYPGTESNPPPFMSCLTTLAKECERCAAVAERHDTGDTRREDMEARRIAAAIRKEPA